MIVVDRRLRDEAADGLDEVRVAAHARAQPPRQARVAAGAAAARAEMGEPGVGIASEALDEGVIAKEVGDRRGGTRRHRHDVIARGVDAQRRASVNDVELDLADAKSESSDSEKFPWRNP